MKLQIGLGVFVGGAVAGTAVLLLSGCDFSSGNSAEGTTVVADAAEANLVPKNDPAWQASHREVGIIRVGTKPGGSLHNFCVNLDGNLLTCWGGSSRGGSGSGPCIKVYSPEGVLVKTWDLEVQPQAICVHSNGSIFVGGEGRILKLNQEGKVLASADSPVLAQKVKLSAATISEMKASGRVNEDELARYTQALDGRKKTITGIGTADQEVFVVTPSPSDFTFQVYRFNPELKEAKLVVEGLRGCCGQMDLQASGDRLWIPHNARHRVECRNRDGKELTAFGKRDRQAADGFGGCCEPKNMRIVGNEVFTAESGPPVVIKRFTEQGKFLGVIALPSFPTSCVRVTIDTSPDHSRWYILDTEQDAIHVFALKAETARL